MLAQARCGPIDADAGTWAIGLRLLPDHPALNCRPPVRFHFVLDNSGSMGQGTVRARDCFAELVGLADGPCSLTLFANQAHLVGSEFRAPAAMRATKLPPQGMTNISDGLRTAVDVIKKFERAATERGRMHHILVLLSDGGHNQGPGPAEVLPQLGADLRRAAPGVRVSAVVVGVTAASSTSMGMQVRQHLETVPLPALQPIYFAVSAGQMQEALGQVQQGLGSLRGSLVEVELVGAPGGTGLQRSLGQPPAPRLAMCAAEAEQALFCTAPAGARPSLLRVDGQAVPIAAPAESEPFDSELAAAALQTLVDDVRMRRVAATDPDSVRPALEQLRGLVRAMEARLLAEQARGTGPGDGGFQLAQATPKARLAQHKAAVRTLHGAKELRNQLSDIEALRTNDSASQAAFLTGAKAKYGAKALRRAAHGDPEGEGPRLPGLLSEVLALGPKLRTALRLDLMCRIVAMDGARRQRVRRELEAQAGTADQVLLVQGRLVRLPDPGCSEMEGYVEMYALQD